MIVLGIDIGSSSVKAGILRDGRVVGRVVRVTFQTRYDGVRAEVDAAEIERAVATAAGKLRRRSVDWIALSVMSPSWVAIDKRGRALTPIITHQDRRSLDEARAIEQRVGRSRHLRLAGNRPFPGGISSTTCAWHIRNERAIMRRADLVGHLNTYLHRRFTGARVVDPSNASFMGLYHTTTLGGWSDELCAAVGVSRSMLPDVLESNRVGGKLNAAGGRALGMPAGTPMLVGMTDAGAAMLLAGARAGQLVNVSGSTDVLALCTDRPRPHEQLLTRALGVGRWWLSVSTLAAAGSAVTWVREQMFRDLSRDRFYEFLRNLDFRRADALPKFQPYLAGDRTSLEQRTASLSGLTLATRREDILLAVVSALTRASAQRLELLRAVNDRRILRDVLVSGGAGGGLAQILRRDWPGQWRFKSESEATLRGLARLEPV